jgi:hypothetical protein
MVFVEVPSKYGTRVGASAGAAIGGGVSAVCDYFSLGWCVAANPAIVATTTAGGAYAGSEAGEWLGSHGSEVVCDPIEEVIDDAKNAIGMLIYGLVEVKCGSISSYKKKLKAGGGTSEEMNRDHIPNTATMKKNLQGTNDYEDLKGKNKSKIRKCMNNSIKSDAQTLGLPKCFHVAGKTYGSNAKVERGGSLSQIQKEDLDHYDSLLKGDFSVISDRSDKQKKAAEECLKKIDPECKKAIKEGIKEKRKDKPEKFMSDTIGKCKNKFSKTTQGKK